MFIEILKDQSEFCCRSPRRLDVTEGGLLSQGPESRVLYLIDEAPTMAFVQRLLEQATEPATPHDNWPPPASRPALPEASDAAAALRELLARVAALQQAGFVCEVGCADAHAIDQVIASSPTLIIIDVVRYNRKTRHLQRDLKQRPATRDIPLIILTNDGRPRLRARAAEIGYESYIVKPALPIQLYAEIRRIGVAAGSTQLGGFF